MRGHRTLLGAVALATLAAPVLAQYPSYPQGYGYGAYPQYPNPQQNTYQAYNPYSRPGYPAYQGAQGYQQPRAYNPYGYPQGQPQYGQPSYGQPSYGQPVYGQPVYGQAMTGQPITIMPAAPATPGALPYRPLPSQLTSTPSGGVSSDKLSLETDLGPSTEKIPTLPRASKEPLTPGELVITDPRNAFLLDGGCKDLTCCPPPCCEKPACPKQCPCPHWYAMGGFLFLQPRWQSNPAFVNIDVTSATSSRSFNNDFNYDWTFSPQVEAGYVGANGFGGRARWWYFDQIASVNSQTATGPAGVAGTGLAIATAAPFGITNFLLPGETATATSRLYLHVFDLEAAQDCWIGQTLLKFGGGAQYTYLDQTYRATQSAGGVTTGTIFAREYLNGVGPTVFLDGMRVFGESGLGVYGRCRGALLFTWEPQVVTASAAGKGHSGQRTRDGTLPILELEAGVQYAQSVGRAILFLRCGCNGQSWFGAGNSSDSSPTALPGGLYDPNGQSRSNLTFLGASVMAGIYY
ncbi:MAG: hypothetical protein FJ271_02250 [Planctomycetes bacterium]|nr:hypothetical protein [Planctomycetota bacterium]